MHFKITGRALLLGALATLAIAAFPSAAGAKNLKVPSAYPTIQAAVNAANPGDKISVSRKAGGAPYSESVQVSTNNITITAAGTGAVVIDGGGIAGSGDGFDLSGNNETIQGFTIQNFSTDPTNIFATRRSGVSSFGTLSALVQNNTITTCDQGVDSEECFDTQVENNTITNTTNEDVLAVESNVIVVTNNTLTNSGSGEGFFFAININGVDNITITGNDIENDQNGIAVVTAAQGPQPPGIAPASPALVNQNFIAGMLSDSLDVDGSYLVTVSQNILCNNPFGLSFINECFQDTATQNIVTGTSLVGIGNAGIIINDDSTAITISNNISAGNQSDGIACLGSEGNTLTGNIAYGNNGPGSVDARDDSEATAATLDNTWKHNTFGVTSPTGIH